MIFAKREKDSAGDYLDGDELRWTVVMCRNARPVTGWAIFDTMEDCLAAWDLRFQPLPKEQPTAEE